MLFADGGVHACRWRVLFGSFLIFCITAEFMCAIRCQRDAATSIRRVIGHTAATAKCDQHDDGCANFGQHVSQRKRMNGQLLDERPQVRRCDTRNAVFQYPIRSGTEATS